MPHANLSWVDYAIMGAYFAFVLGIGFVLKRGVKTGTDFFLAGRAVPAWITGLALQLSHTKGHPSNSLLRPISSFQSKL